MNLRLWAVAGLMIGMVTPGFAQVRVDVCDGPQDACQQLADFASSWDAAFNKHDAVALAALYTPDAVIVAQGPIIRGREAIEKWFADAFESGWSNIADAVDQVHVRGDMAWWIGEWNATGPGPNNSNQSYHGNWGEVVVRDAGTWKIRMNTSNTINTPDR